MPCPGFSPQIKDLLSHPNGHTFVAFDQVAGFTLCCSKCGNHTSGQIKPGLREGCLGRMSRSGRQDWNSLSSRGLHPSSGLAVGSGVPVGRMQLA